MCFWGDQHQDHLDHGASWNEPVRPSQLWAMRGWRREKRRMEGKGAYCRLATKPRELTSNTPSHRFHYWYLWTITQHIPDLHCIFYLIVCIWLLNSGSSKHFTIGSVWACKYFNCVTTSVLFSTSSRMKKKQNDSNQ